MAAINISFVGAYFIRKSLLTFLEKPQLPFFYYYNSLIFTNIIIPLVFYSLGLYRIKTGELWVDELFRIGKGSIICTLFLMASSYLAQGYEFSRIMKFVFAALCIGIMFILRWSVLSLYNGLRKQGFNLRRTLIVGTGSAASVIFRKLQQHRELGFDTVGFVRETSAKEAPDTTIFPILGTIAELPELIRQQNITELIITTSFDNRELILRNKRDGVNVRLVTDFYNLSMHETVLEELAGIPMVHCKGKPLFAFNVLMKRWMDMACAAGALFALAPLMLLIALLIKLASSESIVVREQRVGLRQIPFAMYEFRTKYVKRQAGSGLSRLRSPFVKIGKWMRRYRLDLLPQLFNVLQGKMSLVGPRPLPVRQNGQDHYTDWKQERFDVKPGITGLWQVSGQNDVSFDEMLDLDMYYIWNWSFSSDVKILLRTLPMLFFHPKHS